jgi:RNA polymerase sigma factor (sigma-70 family)
MTSDRDLVLALRRKDPGALDDLYGAYHDRIWRFLARLCRSLPEAEDLYQDTWLAAARHAHRLREDTALLPWLYTIARNKHRNARRAWILDVRRRAGFAAVPRPDGAPPQLDAERTSAAFARLPDAYREVLVLCVVEGLDAPDAARVIGITPDATRKRLSRARAELAQLLGIEGDLP